MSGMKCNLEGLFRNAVANVNRDHRAYYNFCFDEVLGHLKDVVAGKHTIEEFAEHYCLTTPAAEEKTR